MTVARIAGSAFLASYGKKGGCFLLYILAATMRTANVFLIVLVQGENCLEGLVAVVTDVVVYGHEGTSHVAL
jgi:hypothetical protein